MTKSEAEKVNELIGLSTPIIGQEEAWAAALDKVRPLIVEHLSKKAQKALAEQEQT